MDDSFHSPNPNLEAILSEVSKYENTPKLVFSRKALWYTREYFAGKVPRTFPLRRTEVQDSIVGTSSSGWPLCWNKASAFQAKGWYNLKRSGWEMINLNQQVFYAFPKCEIRPKEKDYVHGISAQSFGAYLITVQYCKQFNEWLYSNPFRTMSVVGLCKDRKSVV